MKIIKKSEIIKNIPDLFKKNYYHNYNNEWTKDPFGKLKDQEKQYNALLETTTEDEVEEIIGNRGWTINKCNECNKDFDVTIQVGEEPDYESATARLCFDCLSKALYLMRGEE